MSIRHFGRRFAVQAVYQAAIRNEAVADFLNEFKLQTKLNKVIEKWATSLALESWQAKQESDKLIETYAIGWTIDRMSVVDLSILRVAFYELLHSDTPHTVVLNEAVELAKELGADESSKFVNGILGNYVKDHVYGTDKNKS
ncbi:transcription antitermination factor NusB [Candidatus Marinamargulisbacteria bacterium SCGC AG-414-C22]|nr:transcription antitermination factor NusB [Candidatus Marinamargulisbacteria bacterium SCGC AG-414-C22]